jgi:hypothetical protein
MDVEKAIETLMTAHIPERPSDKGQVHAAIEYLRGLEKRKWRKLSEEKPPKEMAGRNFLVLRLHYKGPHLETWSDNYEEFYFGPGVTHWSYIDSGEAPK